MIPSSVLAKTFSIDETLDTSHLSALVHPELGIKFTFHLWMSLFHMFHSQKWAERLFWTVGTLGDAGVVDPFVVSDQSFGRVKYLVTAPITFKQKILFVKLVFKFRMFSLHMSLRLSEGSKSFLTIIALEPLCYWFFNFFLELDEDIM